jgi:hypothetical protein
MSQLWNVNKMNNAIRLQNANWEAHKKISCQGEVEGQGIDTIIWGKDQLLNPEEWEYALRKYSSFVIQGKMAELNLNDINYFKGQAITNPNAGNKTSLHEHLHIYYLFQLSKPV